MLKWVFEVMLVKVAKVQLLFASGIKIISVILYRDLEIMVAVH